MSRMLRRWGARLAVYAAAALATVSASPFAGASADAAFPAVAAVVLPVGHVDTAAAALLLSGQRGGDLDGVITRGLVSGDGESRTVPLWVEIAGGALVAGPGSGGSTLELVVYALADDGGVEGFLARSLLVPPDLRPALARGGLRIRASMTVSRASASLRVLVRDAAGGAFFLDEIRLPGGDEAPLQAWSPAGSNAWIGAAATADEAAAELVPAGRAVVAPGDTLPLLVAAAGDSAPDLRGLIRDGRQIDVEAAEVEMLDAAPATVHGARLWRAQWKVPELKPGAYSLELALRTAAGAEAASEIVVVVMPAGAAGERPAWPEAQRAVLSQVAVNEAPPNVPPAADQSRRGGRGADERAYREALQALADGERERAVAAVVELERGAVAAVRSRVSGFRGTSGTTERLVATEVAVVDDLIRVRPAAAGAVLDLHVAAIDVWRRQAEPLGLRHALKVLTVLAQRVADAPQTGARPAAADLAAAAAVSAADAILDLNAPGDALELLRLADRLDPGNQSARLGMAAIHEWFGRHRDAVAALEGAQERPEPSPELLLRRAVNLRRVGREREAGEAFRRCLEDDRPAWIRTVAAQELALALIDDERPDESLRVLAEAAREPRPDATSVLLQAYAAAAAGDRAAARRLLDSVERRHADGFRESPRLRYARWPAEVFAAERARLGAAARAARGALGEALHGAEDGRQ